MAPWIIEQFPAHRMYVEPYGGGASVLLRKPRSFGEIYNDLDGEVVNVFRMARDHGQQLKEKLYLTPFARDEFFKSYEPADDPIEQARRTIVRSFMGYGSNSLTSPWKTGFRANSNRSGETPARDWKGYADVFDFLIERMRGVVIENRDALEVMSAQDGPETLHYVDPPYVMESRQDKRADYQFEMDDADHRKLADFLRGLQGKIILSGYQSALYDELYGDWRHLTRAARADGAAKRTEILWLSPNVQNTRLL